MTSKKLYKTPDSRTELLFLEQVIMSQTGASGDDMPIETLDDLWNVPMLISKGLI